MSLAVTTTSYYYATTTSTMPAKEAEIAFPAGFFTVEITDTCKPTDYIKKNVSKQLKDQVVGEHIPSKTPAKSFTDSSKTLDWITKKIMKPFIDSYKALDYMSKTISKVFEFEAPSTGWVVKDVSKQIKDIGKTVDVKLSKYVSKAFKDFVVARDGAYRAVSIVLVDSFVGEYVISRGYGVALRDKPKITDLLTKIAFKLYGKDIGRVYFHKVWGDIIESEDHNVKVEVAKIILDAIKRIKDKLNSM